MNKFEGKWLLPRFYNFIQWIEALIVLIEELISVLSVLLLSFGVVVSMIDFFQGGALSHNPTFSYAWAVIQAVSLDAQVAFTWHKARRAHSQKKTVPFLGFVFIGLMLAFVVWASSSLEGQHQIANNSEPQEPQIISTISHPEEWPYGYDPSVYAPQPPTPIYAPTTTVDNTSVSLLGVEVPSNLLVSIRMGIAVTLLCIAGWTRRLIAEMDTADTKQQAQKTHSKRVKKPFWLAQKWSQIRARFEQKKDTQEDTNEATIEPQNGTQKGHYPNTGELEKVVTQKDTTVDDILATTEGTNTDPELVTPVGTQKATPRVTKKLDFVDTEEGTKSTQTRGTNRGTRKDTKSTRPTAKDRALRVLKVNPNISPAELQRKAKISESYAKKLKARATA